jgi:serine/threonine protein kinase
MQTTPVSLLERLRRPTDQEAWRRFVHLYTPLLYHWACRTGLPDDLGSLGVYRIKKVLGKGGMGVVFAAEDSQLRRPVALKVMRPSFAAKATAKQRFLREARAAAALTHDHIVTIYQVGEENSVPFLAMQLLEGMSLETLLREHRDQPMNITQVPQIGRQIAQGLLAAHAKGPIHRDIKPGNIWLEASATHSNAEAAENADKTGSASVATASSALSALTSSRVKILDFGLARSAAADEDDNLTPITQTGTILGTPAYMAPEQARGLAVDHRADLFSLGCVLYEMTTGKKPFTGRDAMAILTSLAVDTPAPPNSVNAAVPAALSALIVDLLEKDPMKRPASAQQVGRRLGEIERDSHQPEASARPMHSEPDASAKASQASGTATLSLAGASGSARPRRRLPVWAAVAAAVLFIGGGIGLYQVIIIRDKDGNEVARVKVPPGGKFEVEGDGKKVDVKDTKVKGLDPVPVAASPFRPAAPREHPRLRAGRRRRRRSQEGRPRTGRRPRRQPAQALERGIGRGLQPGWQVDRLRGRGSNRQYLGCCHRARASHFERHANRGLQSGRQVAGGRARGRYGSTVEYYYGRTCPYFEKLCARPRLQSRRQNPRRGERSGRATRRDRLPLRRGQRPGDTQLHGQSFPWRQERRIQPGRQDAGHGGQRRIGEKVDSGGAFRLAPDPPRGTGVSAGRHARRQEAGFRGDGQDGSRLGPDRLAAARTDAPPTAAVHPQGRRRPGAGPGPKSRWQTPGPGPRRQDCPGLGRAGG